MLGKDGICGLLHPEGVFDDPKGGAFRRGYYPRLHAHYQFKNELLIFGSVHHTRSYSINVFGPRREAPRFKAAFNLYLPSALITSLKHSRLEDPIPGMKTDDGAWETRGHAARILEITEDVLQTFVSLFEEPTTLPTEARLLRVHSRQILDVFRSFARYPVRLSRRRGDYFSTELFHESNAQDAGVISREVAPSHQPSSADDWILSGPHGFVGSPMYQTARTNPRGNNDYDDLDLSVLPDEFFPRGVYRPGDRIRDLAAYNSAIPEWPEPALPGFWFVAPGDEELWERLLNGERLRFYQADTTAPGASHARRFASFAEAHGEVLEAIEWLREHPGEGLSENFDEVRLTQSPAAEAGRSVREGRLPMPITARFRHANRRRIDPDMERTLLAWLAPAGPAHINSVFTLTFSSNLDALRFSRHLCEPSR